MPPVDATVALGAGTALALGAALVVLGPLWNGAGDVDPSGPTSRAAEPDQPGVTRAEGVSAVEALREIEFDRATGKLSDDDYEALKTTYTRDALTEMRAARERPTGVPVAPTLATGAVAGHDPVEEALRAYRARRSGPVGGVAPCSSCGPRPEDDATFCSDCGRFLAAHCAQCGAICDQEGQRFCTNCGAHLAPDAVAATATVGAGT